MKIGTTYNWRRKAIADGQSKRGPCEICGPATRLTLTMKLFLKPLAVRWLFAALTMLHGIERTLLRQGPPTKKGAKTIYLPKDIVRQLEKASEAEDVSQSVYVMQVLQAHFKRREIE